jgi:hypothetical protein
MPIWWGSTHEMINTACTQEALITAVCATQQIDLSVREIMLTQGDWVVLRDLLKLFVIFAHPMKKLQASTYPTLNYAILQYLQMIKKIKALQQELGYNLSIGVAC